MQIDDLANELNDKPVQHIMRWFVEKADQVRKQMIF